MEILYILYILKFMKHMQVQQSQHTPMTSSQASIDTNSLIINCSANDWAVVH